MDVLIWVRRAAWALGAAGLLITLLAPGWTREPGPLDLPQLTSGLVVLASTTAMFLVAMRTTGSPEYHFGPWGLIPPGTFLLLSYAVMGLAGTFYDRPNWTGLYFDHALMVIGLVMIGIGVRRWAEVMSPRPKVTGIGRIFVVAMASLALIGFFLLLSACVYAGGCELREPVLSEYLAMDLAMLTISMAVVAWLLRSPVLSKFPDSFSALLSVYVLFPFMSIFSAVDDVLRIPGSHSVLANTFYYFLAPPLLAAGIFSIAPRSRSPGGRGDGRLPSLVEICPEWRDVEREVSFLRSISGDRAILLLCHANSPLIRGLESSGAAPTVALISTGIDHPEMVGPRTFRVAPEPAQIINLIGRVRRSSGPLTLVMDNLTDLTMLEGVEHAYRVVRIALEELRDSDAAAFLIAPSAHDGKTVTTFRLLFSERVSLCPGP